MAESFSIFFVGPGGRDPFVRHQESRIDWRPLRKLKKIGSGFLVLSKRIADSGAGREYCRVLQLKYTFTDLTF